jgi:hypothetical protein
MPNLANQKFGYLRVLELGSRSTAHRQYWLCRCRCGALTQVRSDALRPNGTRSCGCLQVEASKALGIHHKPGERFGRLRIVRQAGVAKRHGRVYLCRCDCGRTTEVRGDQLRDGTTRSCGCLYLDTRATVNLRHGQGRAKNPTGTYLAYTRQRGWCRNPRDKYAKYFIGIEFRFDNFPDFYAEVGAKPSPDHFLVRIDRDGHFEPGNLHWVPRPRKHRRKRHLQVTL